MLIVSKSSKILKGILIMVLLITTPLAGIYIGVKNTSDHFYTNMKFPQLSKAVTVSRDSKGVPTISGSNLNDVLFVQGYEIARDRLWQLEFYRSLSNGELSRILGPSLLETDKFIHNILIPNANEYNAAHINSTLRSMVESYIDGINKFILGHLDSLPLEFQLLGVKPKLWQVKDVFGMQSAMALNFAFGGLSTELLRQDTIKKVGVKKMLELFPVLYPPARKYLLSLNHTTPLPYINSKFNLNKIKRALYGTGFSSQLFASNNWVVSGAKTVSGHPLISNDPHLGLAVPGLWYQVNLETPEFHAQGFTLPGTPFVILGHNRYVAWGATSGLTDVVDLYYLNQNGTHYLVNNSTWKPFQLLKEYIPQKDGSNVTVEIKLTDFGPMMNLTQGYYAFQWVNNMKYSNNQIFRSIYDLNTAKSVQDAHNALRYFEVPGLNFVLADVQNNIAYQFVGKLPTRKTGFGLIPHNGSNGQFYWNGTIPYSENYYVLNPSSHFFATANERVDPREKFYISEAFALKYRDARISEVLANFTDFKTDNLGKFTVNDMMRLQADVKTLVAQDLLLPVLPYFNGQISKLNNSNVIQSIKLLDSWNLRMDKNQIAPTIFTTYRLFYTQMTFLDDVGQEITNALSYSGIRVIANLLKTNINSPWFDINGTKKKENGYDIALLSLEKAVQYLETRLGKNMNGWKWGSIHQTYFKHPLSSVPELSFLNIGPQPSNGSVFTVNAIYGPTYHNGKITYSDNYGPSFRFSFEVEPTWSKTYGIYAPGSNGVYLDPNYSSGYNNWLNFKYSHWTFSATEAQKSAQFIYVYSP